MRRREFVWRALGALGAAPLLGGACARASASAPAPRRNPSIGRTAAILQLAPWGGELTRDLDGTLAAARALGISAVEWPSPYAPFTRQPHEVRAALDRAELWAAGTMVGTGLLQRGWDRALEAIRVLGSTHVTATSPGPEERRTAADWPEMIAVYAAAAERAQAVGLRFSVRTDAWMHAGRDGRTPLAALLEAPGAEAVGVSMDVRAAQGIGDAVAAIRHIGPRLTAVHLRPYDLEDRALIGAMRSAAMGAKPRWVVVPEGGSQAETERLRRALAT